MTFKPLLAATLEVKDFPTLKFPLLASAKIDGIRLLVIDGVAVSRNLKPIRNKYVQSILGNPDYSGLDGEVVVGEPTDPLCYRSSNSGVMSADGEPDFKFFVFDDILDGRPFRERYVSLGQKASSLERVVILPHKEIFNVEELVAFEEECLQQGYEGIMLRSPDGAYKNGRSTLKEQILLKLKRFTDFEAVIVGYQERMHNANEAKMNALGHTERSMHKENMVGRGDLGALVVMVAGDSETTGSAQQFTVGSGFTDEERKDFWDNKEKYLGKQVTLRAFNYGGYDLPRFPTYVGLREDK